MLTLSVAAVAVYTNPIMIALLSAALIGEPVTRRQWGGMLLGFLGVVTILRPGTDDFSWFTVLPLLAAAFYALAMVLTRSKCQEEAPLTLALNLHVSFLAAGLIGTIVLTLTGPGVNLASRMEELADPMQIVLCEDMAPLIEGEFNLTELDAVDIKGFGRKQLYQLNAGSSMMQLNPEGFMQGLPV